MRTLKELDHVYNMSHDKPGWITSLLDEGGFNRREIEYVLWREHCDEPIKEKLEMWDKQIERSGGHDIYFAEDEQSELVALERKRNHIDEKVKDWTFEMAEAWRQLEDYQGLSFRLARLKLKLDVPLQIPGWKLSKARLYRLDDLLEPLLKRKYMKCPIHPEKHASFYVTSYGYCFGCLRSWDCISWLMEFNNMTFVEAVDYLANR